MKKQSPNLKNQIPHQNQSRPNLTGKSIKLSDWNCKSLIMYLRLKVVARDSEGTSERD